MLTESEKTLAKGNHQGSHDGDDCLIHQLFEAQVQQNPYAIALFFDDQQLTYQQLNQQANQLAHYLQAQGVGPEVLVGVCLERSLDMVVAMLGILKAGGAYVPLDPHYPSNRLTFMIQDAALNLVITQETLVAANREAIHFSERVTLVCLDRDVSAIRQYVPTIPISTVTPSNLAYIIYTSGSTGKPKGVQIMHRSVVNLLGAIATCPGLNPADISIAVTTISFDVSVPEIYGPLMVGGQVVIASQEATKDPEQLISLIQRHQGTVMSATPATWQMLLNAGWAGSPDLNIISTGERLSLELATQLQSKGRSLWNLYGPTEITVWATAYQVQSEEEATVPIGRAIANAQTYILDENQTPVAIGEVGKLYIGGAGVARGYLNRPQLTTEKFIANPFVGNVDGTGAFNNGDRIRHEQRLMIDPDFFIALKHHLPRITHVELHLKRGHYQNELTRFRYDVVLHVDKESDVPNDNADNVAQSEIELSIETMASTYIQALQTAQPYGPYQMTEMPSDPGITPAIAPANQDISHLQSLITDLNGLFGAELPIDALELDTLDPEAQLRKVLTAA